MYRSNEINQVIVLVIFIQYVCPICGEKYAIFGMEISLKVLAKSWKSFEMLKLKMGGNPVNGDSWNIVLSVQIPDHCTVFKGLCCHILSDVGKMFGEHHDHAKCHPRPTLSLSLFQVFLSFSFSLLFTTVLFWKRQHTRSQQVNIHRSRGVFFRQTKARCLAQFRSMEECLLNFSPWHVTSNILRSTEHNRANNDGKRFVLDGIIALRGT